MSFTQQSKSNNVKHIFQSFRSVLEFSIQQSEAKSQTDPEWLIITKYIGGVREDRAMNSQIPSRNRNALDDSALIALGQLRLTGLIEPHPQLWSPSFLLHLARSGRRRRYHGGEGVVVGHSGGGIGHLWCREHESLRRRLLRPATAAHPIKPRWPLPHSLFLQIQCLFSCLSRFWSW